MRFILFFIIFLIGCSPVDHDVDYFNDILFSRWVSTIRINQVNEHFSNKKIISEPKGTWQVLMGVEYISDINLDSSFDCLLYKIGKNTGTLKVVNNKKFGDCNNTIFEEGIEIENISNVSFDLKRNLIISGIKNNKEIKMKFRFLNRLSDKKILTKKYSSSELRRLIPGALIQSSERIQGKEFIPIEDGKFCHNLNDNCTDEIINSCDQCSSGWYPIINSACKKKYSKVCGRNVCGQKGEAACIRGYEWIEYDEDYCINDSPIGFCNKGLRVICDKKKLICL